MKISLDTNHPIQVIMGIQMSRDNSMTIAASVVGAMTVKVGGRLIAGETLKLIPGMGTVPGGMINSEIASAVTYGLGYGYIESSSPFSFCRAANARWKRDQRGVPKFWEKWEKKDMNSSPQKASLVSR